MRVVWSILLLLAFLPGYSGEGRLTLWPSEIKIKVERVDLDWRKPLRKQVGELTYLGGVRITSAVGGFGGFSALSVVGDHFTLLSDGGNFLRFRLNQDWQFSEIGSGALLEGPGTGWRKLHRDSESLAHDPITGSFWVGYEYANEIWRYDSKLQNGKGVAPAAMAKWARNGGAESLVRLRDGSFLVFAERARAKLKGTYHGLWFQGDPIASPSRPTRFAYRPPKGFNPTDATELPDGRIVILNRRVTRREGFTAAVTILDRSLICSGAVAIGREVARFKAPVLHDNFEALAASSENGETILWLASDDNQQWFQRSLLLKFRLGNVAYQERSDLADEARQKCEKSTAARGVP